MPFYEFECKSCGATLERLLTMGRSIRKCPECGKPTLKKLFSQVRYHDTYSPMHPRRGRGVGGFGRVNPGVGQPDLE